MFHKGHGDDDVPVHMRTRCSTLFSCITLGKDLQNAVTTGKVETCRNRPREGEYYGLVGRGAKEYPAV